MTPAVADKHITLTDVAVRYLLLTEDQRTFKGRVLNLFSNNSNTAEFWALENISLNVAPGEIVGMVGRNGSGKSTLLRVMARIIEPSRGTVDVSGEISPLLELGSAFSGELTGRENAFLYGAMFKFTREEMDELMPRIVAFSELGSFFDIPIKCYSSGMVARLAFAVSTQVRPDILLIDEVFAVGDDEFQKKCFFRVRKMIERGSIVVLVSHSSPLIEQLCNRVIYLQKGQVRGDGKPREVLTQYHRESSQEAT